MQTSTERLALDNDASPRDSCGARYRAIRRQTEVFCAPLHSDDFNLQAMPDVSPPKWHLAHTTWFFETFVLKAFCANYKPYHPQFEALFNSYYNGVGAAPFPRAQRGLLSRPTTSEVFNYRSAIDQQMLALLKSEHPQRETILRRVELGLQLPDGPRRGPVGQPLLQCLMEPLHFAAGLRVVGP